MTTAKIMICDWNEPYLIEGISEECLEAYQMARNTSASFEERVQYVKALIELVHAGDVNAEYCLGLLTRNDFTDDLNAQKSELWFSSAAAQGHSYAAYHYALCLEKRGELEKAKAWYEKAAAAGVPYARCRLAKLSIRMDTERAIPTIQLCTNNPHPRTLSGAKWWESTQRCKRAMQAHRREYTIYDRHAWFIAHDQKEVIA